MNHKYRVYNSLTGHEYGDVDTYGTACPLRDAIDAGRHVVTIDILVAERVS
ncbi:hypothetical protein [Curtobacterium sp. MCLR17_034]|uniref:hypothetical protein n=1 Tax=Curtobacterium sp. MCLR17_034 TaxID=2175623 RepID=UPI0015E89BF1|nr:hypothetical protein [Curtobacterium sp. MCLR17_034]